MNDDREIPEWRARMEVSLAAFRGIDLGYPQDENFVAPPGDLALLPELVSRARLDPNSPLLRFYRACNEVSLPDVHNGYFVASPSLLLRWQETGEPSRLTGPFARDILVFGRDGGGGRFAIGADGVGDVLHLGEGAVHDRVFDGFPLGGYEPVRILAPDFHTFLERMLADLEAFVRYDEGWQYMI